MTNRRVAIVDRDGELEPECVDAGGTRQPLSWLHGLEREVARAWWDVALDENRSRAHREQAIKALIQIAHDSHDYDCLDI